jgi:amino acid transporter
MEYAIGNITVAIGWSGYFTSLLDSMGYHMPEWMTIDYLSASNAYQSATEAFAGGATSSDLGESIKEGYKAWLSAPSIGGFRLIADFPALLIITLITWLVYRGIKESKNAGNAMVVIKLAVVLLVIAVGIFYVDTDNWDPFTPNGATGILKGVSAVFFAYIGFDAISTTAEECKNPQRDLPKGMMWSIIICTVLYVLIALVLTGMVNYNNLAVNDPLAFVFQKLNLKWLSGIIAVSAVVAMASVLLVFQLGQPRIWMSMSRDGLLPKRFAKIHPKFNTPSFSTIITGLLVGGGALFMNMSTVTDLCSIGTLFAFVLVCAGVLRLETLHDGNPPSKFKTPYINSKFIAPGLLILAIVLIFIYNPYGAKEFVSAKNIRLDSETFASALTEKGLGNLPAYSSSKWNLELTQDNLSTQLSTLKPWVLKDLIRHSELPEETKYESGLGVFAYNIPMWIFWIIAFFVTIKCFTKKYSLIPVLGLLCCLYMMAQIDLKNWIGFTIWLIIGLVIYFSYSRKNSKLAQTTNG